MHYTDLALAAFKTLAGVFMYGSIPATLIYFSFRKHGTRAIQERHMAKNLVRQKVIR